MSSWLMQLVAGVLGRWQADDFDEYVWSDPLATPLP
jgi:hypothetical protein